jgi:hypothetical protein
MVDGVAVVFAIGLLALAILCIPSRGAGSNCFPVEVGSELSLGIAGSARSIEKVDRKLSIC